MLRHIRASYLVRLVARESDTSRFFSASARVGHFRLIDPNQMPRVALVHRRTTISLFEPVRVEFERAAILRHRPHCVLGNSVRHLCFNLKRDFRFLSRTNAS